VREDAFYSKVGVSVGSGVEGVLDGRRLGAWVGGDVVGSKLVGGKDVNGASDGRSVGVKVCFELGCSVWLRLVILSTIESCEFLPTAIPVTTPPPKAASARIMNHHTPYQHQFASIPSFMHYCISSRYFKSFTSQNSAIFLGSLLCYYGFQLNWPSWFIKGRCSANNCIGSQEPG
jgi:hypothetical protein